LAVKKITHTRFLHLQTFCGAIDRGVVKSSSLLITSTLTFAGKAKAKGIYTLAFPQISDLGGSGWQ
jgi:hypothetical protein